MQRSGHGPCQQAIERAVSGRPPPEHPQQERREQRPVHEREHELQHVEDVVEARGAVGRQHARDDAEHRRRMTDAQIVPVGSTGADVRLINVVRPDRVERRDVAGHAGHEGRHQRGESQSQHPGRHVMREHHRDGEVVVRLAIAPDRQESAARRVEADRQHARQNHEQRHEHLRNRRDQRRPARGGHRAGRHRALHDQEVRAPVAERQREPQAHHQAKPLDPHRIVTRRIHVAPGV